MKTKFKDNDVIDGQDVTGLFTINSMYANEKLRVTIGKNTECRIDVSEFMKLINGTKFRLTKKRKYLHLEVAQ